MQVRADSEVLKAGWLGASASVCGALTCGVLKRSPKFVSGEPGSTGKFTATCAAAAVTEVAEQLKLREVTLGGRGEGTVEVREAAAYACSAHCYTVTWHTGRSHHHHHHQCGIAITGLHRMQSTL